MDNSIKTIVVHIVDTSTGEILFNSSFKTRVNNTVDGYNPFMLKLKSAVLPVLCRVCNLNTHDIRFEMNFFDNNTDGFIDTLPF